MATRRPLVLVGGELKELPAGDTMLSALLGATTVGDGLLKLPNPGALSFLRINADDTISALAAADFRSAIGAGTSSFSGVYSALSGIPASFPPAAHSHAYSALSGIPASFPPAAHSHAYSALTGIPATFTPAAHSHGWDGITDKPTAFAPSAHNQAWSTITTTPTTLSGYGITDAQGSDADLTALAGLSANGLIARTGSGTAAARTITGTANQVIVTNGDGAAGNPTLSLPQSIATTSTPLFAGVGVNGAAASFRLLQFYTGGVRRINVGTDGAGESGANAGSNFQISRFDDAGNSLGAALFIQRSTSNVGIGTTSPQTLLHVGSGNESPAATNPGALKVHTSGAELESVGGIELPVATGGYSVKIQGVSDSGAALVFANRAASATWSERMRISANGNVGINTASPSGILDVAKPSSGGRFQVVNEGADVYNVIASRNAADSAYLSLTMRTTGLVVGSPSAGVIQQIQAPGETRMFVTNTTASISCQVGSSPSSAYVGSYTSHPLELRTADTPRMLIGVNGNVGIGASAPESTAKLYIADSAYSRVHFVNGSGGYAFFGLSDITTSNGLIDCTNSLRVSINGSEKMRINGDGNGNVGINNTNPLRKLDVVGDANGNGIRVTGTTGTIGAFTAEGTSVNIQADSAAATSVLVDAGSSNASGFVVLNGGSSGYVQLGTGGTARMQVFASGVVKLNYYGAGTLQTDAAGNITANASPTVTNLNATGTVTVNSGGFPAGTVRNITISTAAPSGGADGDVWLQYAA